MDKPGVANSEIKFKINYPRLLSRMILDSRFAVLFIIGLNKNNDP